MVREALFKTCFLISDVSVSDSHGFLDQTTCIVLTPVLMKKLRSHFGYVEVIEGLLHTG